MKGYATDSSFYDLYYDFTGAQDPNYPKNKRSIAEDLAVATAQSNQSDSGKGQLIVTANSDFYIYDDQPGHKLLGKATFRTEPNSGFMK